MSEEAENEEPPKEESAEEVAKEYGYKDYKTYVDEGGDPDMFRGPKAFMDYREMKDKGKEKYANLEGKMDDMVTHFAQATTQQKEAHRKELDKALAEAKEDSDIDKYAEVSKEIQELEKTPQKIEEPQVVRDFRKSLPELDLVSDKFNKSFNASVEMQVNQKSLSQSQKLGRQLSDLEMSVIMNEVVDEVKPDFPHLFKTRKRKNPPKQGDGPSKGDKKADPLLSLDAESREMYDFLKSKDERCAKT